MTIKLALPTGDAKSSVRDVLAAAGIDAPVYESGSRLLRSHADDAGMTLRVFKEKDIPVQVALGNYDLGICGDLWISEQQLRFPGQQVTRLGGLPGPATEVWVCAAPEAGVDRLPRPDAVIGARIATEFPNLGDAFATNARIPGYHLLPLWGSADGYPPEDADFVLYPGASAEAVREAGLVPLARLYSGGLALIANTKSLGTKDLGAVLGALSGVLTGDQPEVTLPSPAANGSQSFARDERDLGVARLAVPDGHAQRHTFAGLQDAGFAFEGYEEKTYVRRPKSGVAGLDVKVIRPQDMSQFVAMGAFDAAVTGIDWVTDHLSRFPASPIEVAVDLGRSRYRIGPVVDQAFPAETTAEAMTIWNNLGRPVRIASEYPALAEQFARDQHLYYAAIIPINGASEGFVPEDADILIEGSETGSSIRANGLKMLDPFMESTNCLIVRKEPLTTARGVLDELVERLRAGVAATA